MFLLFSCLSACVHVPFIVYSNSSYYGGHGVAPVTLESLPWVSSAGMFDRCQLLKEEPTAHVVAVTCSLDLLGLSLSRV
jgi:hypothetical protein